MVERAQTLIRTLQPGWLALHGNRMEDLAQTVAEWLQRHPLESLEAEVVLVQSNAMAEWFKMTMAVRSGVSAALRVELPSRFLWRSYRQVLGAQVGADAPTDKAALTWRLLKLLPALTERPDNAPLAHTLRSASPHDHYLLARRLADLWDQYQVYRPDWLDDWAHGRDGLRGPGGALSALPESERWQPALWREVLQSLTDAERAAARPQVHRRALDALLQGHLPAQGAQLPRRVILFGMAHVPQPVLDWLAAMARHSQVLLAIPNPCRYHWADIMDGREWLRMHQRRLPARAGRDLADVPLEQMHLHAHPLLAAWGRQSRDFVRQLDAYEDAAAEPSLWGMPRLDLFDDGEAQDAPLLQQVQHRIRDLVPLSDHPQRTLAPDDRSIQFHAAHGALREVEVLHDQLLELLAHPPQGRALHPRDIVVMVPDIDAMAPAIRAVFAQYPSDDARHIPFDIADQSPRTSQPLMAAVEWLWGLPARRCTLSELHGLLDVPALAARFGVQPQDRGTLVHWMAQAGIRWGLTQDHRNALDLPLCGATNSAHFGLQRMLLGYAGGATRFADIEPCTDVGGLDAALAGALAALLERLEAWRCAASQPATPEQWAQRLRALWAACFAATDDSDRQVLESLEAALEAWLQACDGADFAQPLPLETAHDAVLQCLELPSTQQRFRAGGVTFCTLMPMRAIPFDVVCLLGMNDGDYPRRTPRNDFDLMAQPGQARPGDRSRQTDDRQLMLDALLAARRVFYVSWTGRNVRDNTEQPPSVLVAQLRDYLQAAWGPQVLAERTTEHPLQPFSARYFQGEVGLFTHAREWREAHAPVPEHVPVALQPLPAREAAAPLALRDLANWMRHPARYFLRKRLGVVFDRDDDAPEDSEPFHLAGLERHTVARQLLDFLPTDWAALPYSAPQHHLGQALQRLRRAGLLPLGTPGDHIVAQWGEEWLPPLQTWQGLQRDHAQPGARVQLIRTADLQNAINLIATSAYPASAGVQNDLEPYPLPSLQDWLDGLRCNAAGQAVWMQLTPSRLLQDAKKRSLRADLMIQPWLCSLAAAASGTELRGLLVARDVWLEWEPLEPKAARTQLDRWLYACRQGLRAPLPLPRRTAWALLESDAAARTAYEGNSQMDGEAQDPAWARFYPDYDALAADGSLAEAAQALWAPLEQWTRDAVRVHDHGAATATATPAASSTEASL